MTRKVVKYFTDGREGQQVTAIVGSPGRIYSPMVFIDSPIRLSRIANGELDTKACREIPYPPRKAATAMLKAGKLLGITKGAKAFLRSCK